MKFNNKENLKPTTDKASMNVASIKFFENVQTELNQLASQISALSEVVTGMETVVRTGTINAENINTSDTVATKDLSATGNSTLNDVNAHNIEAHDIEATGELKAASAKVTGKVKANEVEAATVNAETANIDHLNFDTLNADNANIDDLDAGDINATNVKATKLEGSQGDIDTVNATDVNSTDVTATGKVTTKDLENTGNATLKNVEADKISSDLIHNDILTTKRIRVNPDNSNVAWIPENGFICIPAKSGVKVTIYADRTSKYNDTISIDTRMKAALIIDYSELNFGKPAIKVVYSQDDKFFDKVIVDTNGNLYFHRSDREGLTRRAYYVIEDVNEVDNPYIAYALTTYAEGAEPYSESILESELDSDSGIINIAKKALIAGDLEIDGNLDVTGTVNFGAGEIDHAKYLGKTEKITGDDDGNLIATENADIGGDLSVGGDAAVTGDATVSGKVTADSMEAANGFTGDLTGDVTGDLTGTAEKATGDKNGDDITTTYQKKLTAGNNLSIQEISGVLTISCNIDTMNFKGSVTNQTDLPASDNDEGDIYNVTSDGTWWCWNGTDWVPVGAVIDLKQVAKTTLNATYVVLSEEDWEYWHDNVSSPGPNDDFSKVVILCNISSNASGISASGSVVKGYGNPVIQTSLSADKVSDLTLSGVGMNYAHNYENCKFINCTFDDELYNIKNCTFTGFETTFGTLRIYDVEGCEFNITALWTNFIVRPLELENVKGCIFNFAATASTYAAYFDRFYNVVDCTFSELHGNPLTEVQSFIEDLYPTTAKGCKFTLKEGDQITQGTFTDCEIDIAITTIYNASTYKANITGGEFSGCKIKSVTTLTGASTLFDQPTINGGEFFNSELNVNSNAQNYNQVLMKGKLSNCKLIINGGFIVSCESSDITVNVTEMSSLNGLVSCNFHDCKLEIIGNTKANVYETSAFMSCNITNTHVIFRFPNGVDYFTPVMSSITNCLIELIGNISSPVYGSSNKFMLVNDFHSNKILIKNTASTCAFSSTNDFISGCKANASGGTNVTATDAASGGWNTGRIINNYTE